MKNIVIVLFFMLKKIIDYLKLIFLDVVVFCMTNARIC
jgi:hypothetical protein